MASTCLSFLAVLSLIQLVVIYLLSNECYSNSSNNIQSLGQNFKSSFLPYTNLATSNDSIQSDFIASSEITKSIQSPIIYEGVAVTLMLHTPTWFQRRYTMMMFNVMSNLPSTWAIQIISSGKGQARAGIDINLGLKRHIEGGRVIVTVLPEEMSKYKKFQVMLSSWLWKNVVAEKVLIFGGNSVICSNSPFVITDFIKFDYIGSPWDFKKGAGGDGGISLRSRSRMLAAIEYELSKIADPTEHAMAHMKWGQEDRFYVSRLIEMNEKGLLPFSLIANRDDTMRFSSIGAYTNLTTFTASGTLPWSKFADREVFLSYCPEIKMIFPSLHDPNCFGASPNGEECAKSICALQVPRRKGGC